MRVLADTFAVDVAAYAILSNHLHIVVRTTPERVHEWDDREVAKRWLRVFSGHRGKGQLDGTPSAEAISRLASDPERVALLRCRLASLSWFMRSLKEPLAHLANTEDGVTGHFWEGRFRSHRVLDLAGLLATMVYVDLNVIRAGLARTPEQSKYTSVRDRIHVRQRHHKSTGLRERAPKRADELLIDGAAAQVPVHAEDGIWLAPIESRAASTDASHDAERRAGVLPVTLDEYLTIVDQTGRMVRGDKAGAIPSDLASILTRLRIDVERWVTVMSGLPRLFGTVVGGAVSRASEAARRGVRWVCDVMQIDCPA
ncbi:MAG: transposase [bacterium]|nr:transposase [bacterium]